MDRVSFFSTLVFWVGSRAIGPVATFGLVAAGGYVLTASVAYLFVRRLTGKIGPALIAGLAYGFSQHMFIIVWAASTYSHMWLFILPMWAFWRLHSVPSISRGVVAGISVIPAIFWTPYYALHVMVVAGASALVTLFSLFRSRRSHSTLPIAAVVVLPWIAALSLYVFLGSLTSFAEVPERSSSDAYEQAAHPLMFVTPGQYSIWGNAPSSALVRKLPQARGVHLYVGLSVLLLAVIGAVSSLRDIRRSRALLRAHHETNPSNARAFGGVLGLAVVSASFLFSLPPTVEIAGMKLVTPNFLVTQTVPALRAGQRLIMPLMAGMSVLAGLGVHRLTRNLNRRRIVPVVTIVALVIALDSWTRPPEAVSQIPRFEALERLSSQPRGSVFHYPVRYEHETLHGTQVPCLLRSQHRNPLMNVCEIGPEPPVLTRARFAQLGQTNPCDVFLEVRQAGVRYLAIDRTRTEALACLGTEPSAYPIVLEDRSLLIVRFY